MIAATKINLLDIRFTRYELEEDMSRPMEKRIKFLNPEEGLKILQNTCDHSPIHRSFDGSCNLCGKKMA